MTLDRGTKLGPCEILARLGAGGPGEVSGATDARFRALESAHLRDRLQ